MNIANKLTMLRVILIPFFVLFMLLERDNFWMFLVADIIFIIASLTDMLDGKLARKYNLVTNFGKFMDPLADKLLVCSALVCLTDLGKMPSWIVIVIISREFIISGFRLIAADQGIVIAASYWGKFKTVFQMACIILMIVDQINYYIWLFAQIFMYIALILTIISLIEYLYKNRNVLKSV